MECNRFQSDGMRLLDGELTEEEKSQYEAHVGQCDDCRHELESLGRVVALTDELRLRVPDDEFWDGYWESVYRRSERSFGFFLVIAGVLAVLLYGVFKAVTSPKLFTYEGISVTVILFGLVVIFVSVARERYHESKNDPYRGVKR
ncbi:MAG: zf-HC2 domain-containing protein [Candidatus Krumholzibacteria bacterium]|nr:zf-HC2 domain-containing protein [Candidatus Krumholzibacteria bacterium]